MVKVKQVFSVINVNIVARCFSLSIKIIIDMAMNSSGVRDTARVLGISKNTVIRVLTKTKDVVSYTNTEYIEKKTPLT